MRIILALVLTAILQRQQLTPQLVAVGPTPDASRLLPWRIEDRIVREAGPVLAPLALAVGWRESKLGVYLVGTNPDGQQDLGIFQLHPATARGLGVDPMDSSQNIRAGVRLLADGYRRFGTMAGADCWFEHPARCH
jgi:soluble lytic murein transglycosylase-like protein